MAMIREPRTYGRTEVILIKFITGVLPNKYPHLNFESFDTQQIIGNKIHKKGCYLYQYFLVNVWHTFRNEEVQLLLRVKSVDVPDIMKPTHVDGHMECTASRFELEDRDLSVLDYVVESSGW